MNKYFKRLLGSGLLMMLLVCVGVLANPSTLTAKADYRPTNIKQTTVKKKSMKISWTAADNAAKYEIRLRDSDRSYDKTVTIPGTQTSYEFTSLKPAKEYWATVSVINSKGYTYSGTNYYLYTAPDTIKGFKTSTWLVNVKSTSFTWNRLDSSAIDGYKIVLYNSKGKKVKSATAKGYSSYTDFSGLKQQLYKATIRAYKTINGKKYYSKTATTYAVPDPALTSADVVNGTLQLSWKKVSGATGYDVFVSTAPDSGYKKVKSLKGSKVTIGKFKNKSFKSSTRYYIKVQAKLKKGSKTFKSPLTYYYYTR